MLEITKDVWRNIISPVWLTVIPRLPYSLILGEQDIFKPPYTELTISYFVLLYHVLFISGFMIFLWLWCVLANILSWIGTYEFIKKSSRNLKKHFFHILFENLNMYSGLFKMCIICTHGRKKYIQGRLEQSSELWPRKRIHLLHTHI